MNDPSPPPSARDAVPRGGPLQLLFERGGLPRFALPAGLENGYGGPLGFCERRVIANFVASVDGIVSVGGGSESGHIVSGDSEADRFVMGILRSCADAILIGAGTFRRDMAHVWTAEAVYPKAAALFDETRHRLGLGPRPTLVVLTASGAIDPGHPALADALIATTTRGVSVLRRRLPSTARLLAFDPGGDGAIPLAALLERLRADGLNTLLTEGGPRLFGALLAQKLVDELFLTLSPALFGRYPGDERRSLVDGQDLAGSALDLISARRHGSHLFLRYALAARPAGAGDPPSAGV